MEKHTDKLKYKKAIINIIYSFTWDVTECDFNEIVESSKNFNDWKKLFLFERPIVLMNDQKQASYHPNIISQNLSVLHREEEFNDDVEIIVPLSDSKIAEKIFSEEIPKEIITRLAYSLRIYENGSGNCTFTFDIKEPTFYKIHSILRLSSSIFIDEQYKISQTKVYETFSKIRVCNSLKKFINDDQEESELIRIFDAILNDSVFPTIWKSKDLWFDKKIINKKSKCFNNWQTPYALSIIELDETEYRDFEDNQKKETIKELGSIACRLSSENESISSEYIKLKREYIFDSLGFYRCQFDEVKNDSIRLKNYSHHADLFYTIGKRAAIAISPDLNKNPSYYVCPTLLNLIEILRSRWHLGSIVNLSLDDMLEKISKPEINLDKMQDEIFKCRLLFGLFLKDPTPYLFDGGAITEIAEVGENIFWIKRLSHEMEKKFIVIDKLIDDIYSRRRYKELFK